MLMNAYTRRLIEQIQRCQKASISSCFYFWNIAPACLLSRCVSYYKCTPAAQTRLRCLPKLWVFSQPKSREQEEKGGWGCKGRVGRGAEQGFITFNTICIIVCISCSVSTQSQHGWSVLISKLHHKDKRNTCRYKVISLPTAHVKLFRRTRQARSYCGCMNGQIITLWFLKAKSQILIEEGSLLLWVNHCKSIVQLFYLFFFFSDLLIWVLWT